MLPASVYMHRQSQYTTTYELVTPVHSIILVLIGAKSGRMGFQDGDQYDGELSGGRRNGHGICKFADGGVYEGEWRDGKRYGKGKFIYVDIRQFVGYYVNNK